MIDILEVITDKVGIILGVAFAIIVVIAIIRTVIKASKGKPIYVPPVGAMKDLPSSITGVNKNGDLSDWSNERSDNR